MDTLDSAGYTTLANSGDGQLSTREVDAFVTQVTAFGGAGFSAHQQRAMNSLYTLAHTADQSPWLLPQAAWKWVAPRPANPMPQSVKVTDLPTSWEMKSPEGRFIARLNLQDIGKRAAGGRSTLTLQDLDRAVAFLGDQERYGAKQIADAIFFSKTS